LLRGGGKKIKQDFCDITIPNTRLSARGLADDFVCFLALRAPSWLANPARKIAAETKCALRSWRGGGAELHRLEGIALLGLKRLDEGQRTLRAVAQRQQAKAHELRAATCLARLWGEQSKRREARELLAPVYGWFTEGFDGNA
jgi:hypothetical protein